jgi:Flp pilus assembly protein CpaB
VPAGVAPTVGAMPAPTEPTAPAFADRRARLRRRLRRTVLVRRRALAAVCTAVAVVAGIHAARPAAPRTVGVSVAAHDLASGTVLTRDDLVVRQVPASLAPLGSAPRAVGRTLAAPVRAGEPVTDVRLVGPSVVEGYPGRVALPVRIADAEAVALLRAGDHVDLVAADPRRGTASAVAIAVPVVSIPHHSADDTGSAALPGRLVVVAALPSDVDRIVGATATDLLNVVITG